MGTGERKGSKFVSQMRGRAWVGTAEQFQCPEGPTARLAAGRLLDAGTGTGHPPRPRLCPVGPCRARRAAWCSQELWVIQLRLRQYARLICFGNQLWRLLSNGI